MNRGTLKIIISDDFRKKAKKYLTKVVFKKNDKELIKKIKIPKDSSWDKMTIRFKNAHDVKVFIEGIEKGIVSNVDLGCSVGNDELPDVQWRFLQTLSTNSGEYDTNPKKKNTSEYEKIRSKKSKLVKALKKCFGLPGEPIITEKGIYKTVFKLEPEKELREDNEEVFGIQDINKELLPNASDY